MLADKPRSIHLVDFYLCSEAAPRRQNKSDERLSKGEGSGYIMDFCSIKFQLSVIIHLFHHRKESKILQRLLDHLKSLDIELNRDPMIIFVNDVLSLKIHNTPIINDFSWNATKIVIYLSVL